VKFTKGIHVKIKLLLLPLYYNYYNMVDMGVCEEGGGELMGWNIIVQRKGPLQ
jgi:hypothetical protein